MTEEVRTFEHLNEEFRTIYILNSLFVCSIVLTSAGQEARAAQYLQLVILINISVLCTSNTYPKIPATNITVLRTFLTRVKRSVF